MKKKNKVITIKGDESKWYDKAIFISKNKNELNDIDFADEAEYIINQYLLKTSFEAINTKKTKKNNSQTFIDKYLYYAVIVCSILLLISYFTLFFK